MEPACEHEKYLPPEFSFTKTVMGVLSYISRGNQKRILKIIADGKSEWVRKYKCMCVFLAGRPESASLLLADILRCHGYRLAQLNTVLTLRWARRISGPTELPAIIDPRTSEIWGRLVTICSPCCLVWCIKEFVYWCIFGSSAVLPDTNQKQQIKDDSLRDCVRVRASQ